MSEKVRLEGRVVSVDISEPQHGFSSYDKKMPYVTFSVKNGSEKIKEVKMQIDIGESGKELMRKAVIGQTILFEEESEYRGPYRYTTKRVTIQSGQCQGVKYEHLDEV